MVRQGNNSSTQNHLKNIILKRCRILSELWSYIDASTSIKFRKKLKVVKIPDRLTVMNDNFHLFSCTEPLY